MPTIAKLHHLVAAAAVAFPLAACGDDQSATGPSLAGAAQQEQSPTPGGVELFTDGEFDGIPVPRGATEVSEKTERAGAVAQSFTVEATSPGQIMDFYADQLRLAGWQIDEPVRSTGTDSFAGAWVRDDDRLEVSSLLAQGIDDARSQFSLVLVDGLVTGEELNDGG